MPFSRLLAVLASAGVTALLLVPAAPARAETLYLTAGRLVDPVAGDVVRDAALVIEDDW